MPKYKAGIGHFRNLGDERVKNDVYIYSFIIYGWTYNKYSNKKQSKNKQILAYLCRHTKKGPYFRFVVLQMRICSPCFFFFFFFFFFFCFLFFFLFFFVVVVFLLCFFFFFFFCLKLLQGLYCMAANSRCSGGTAHLSHCWPPM